MKRSDQPSVVELLRRVALAPEEQARAAWSAIGGHLDLDDLSIGQADVLAVVGRRLAGWGIDDDRLDLFAGARRRNWALGSVALRSVIEQALATGRPPLLVGRAATVVAYLPAPGLLGVEHPEVSWAPTGETLWVRTDGVDVRVPAPAEHLVWALRARQWLDAAFVVAHPEMHWEHLRALPAARRPSVYSGLVVLDDVLGGIVPEAVLEGLRPPGWARAAGRLSSLGGTILFRLRSRAVRAPRRAPGERGPGRA